MGYVLYICKKFEICPLSKTSCSKECTHTTREEFAKYREHTFEEDDNGNLWEVDHERSDS